MVADDDAFVGYPVQDRCREYFVGTLELEGATDEFVKEGRVVGC